MTTPIFPSLPGLSFGIVKRTLWSTKVQTAASGAELRAAYYSAPKMQFTLPFEFLRQRRNAREMETLLGFVNGRQGSFGVFYYQDPDDGVAYNEPFAVADGVTKRFQLARTYGGATQPVVFVDSATFVGAPTMWDADGTAPMWADDGSTPMWGSVSVPSWTLLDGGIVEYSEAPAGGQTLVWSGRYYYRCRFAQDSYDFTQMFQRHWTPAKIDFIGSLSGKV